MTREEREKHLDWLRRLKSEIFVSMPTEWIIPMVSALNVAIEALDTVDAVEEIKAEIKLLPNANPSYWNRCDVVDREEVLELIDKHISRKEQE